MLKKTLGLLAIVSLLGADDYQKWLQEQQKEFTQYKKSIDEEFASMLKKDWEAYRTMYIPNPYKEPKPKKLPQVKKEVVIPKKEIKDSPKVKVKPILVKKVVTPKVKPKPIEVKKDKNTKTINIDFYSQNLQFEVDKKIIYNIDKITKKAISNYWEVLSKSDYKALLKQIETYSKQLNLNDWAKYQLVYKLGEKIYSNTNEANLFTWFNFVKMKHDMKIGYSNKKIYLLSTIKHNLYQIAFYRLDNKRYYVLTPNGRVGKVGSMYTYKGNYPKSKDSLSFEINKDIKFYTNINKKDLNFTYLGKKYTIDTNYSSDLVDFYKSFPQSDYQIYFSTKNSPILANSLLKSLEPLIKNKSEIEAVNILLRFTQTAFAYKTDQNQFDYEKVMFPEETIFYPYSDCEDRSIMFSFLVKNLLGLNVVGVKYDGHLATAVSFSSNISGDKFKYRGKIFTIADPTYINANAGMAMPQYKKSKFEIISLQ